MNAPISPAGSAIGWSWRVWFAKQKSVLKSAAALLLAFLASVVPETSDPNLRAGIALVVGLASRAALDWLDFYLSDVPVEPPQ